MLVVNSVTDTTSAIIYTIAANLPPKVKKASKHGQNFQCKKSFPKRAAVLTQLSCGGGDVAFGHGHGHGWWHQCGIELRRKENCQQN